MGPIAVSIATSLATKGLLKISERIFSSDKGIIGKLKEKLGMLEDSTEDELNERLKNITEEELSVLLDFDHALKVEEEVTARLSIDTNSDGWLTKNVRPIMLISLSLLYIIFVYVSSFVLKDVGARESAEVFGNQLFMLLVPVYAFYFGGRSFEKILRNRK